MRLTLTHILVVLALVLTVAPAVAAQCTLYSSSFNYSYTNNGNVTNRVTFVLLNKTSSAIDVTFSPDTLIVLPGERLNFSVVATSSSDPGQQLAWFDIRRGADIIARAAAPFDSFACAQGTPVNETAQPSARPLWRNAVFYAAISLFVLILILGIVLLVFSRGPRRGRVAPAKADAAPERPGKGGKAAKPSKKAEVAEERHRVPVNVDAMLREHDAGARTPWWLWLLIAIAALIVIGVFVWLVASGMDVSGFRVGAGVNASNLTNATA